MMQYFYPWWQVYLMPVFMKNPILADAKTIFANLPFSDTWYDDCAERDFHGKTRRRRYHKHD